MPELLDKIQTKNCMNFSASIGVVIVAAGRGSRAQTILPKQYSLLFGKTVLNLTLKNLQAILPQAPVVVVIHPDDELLLKDSTAGLTHISVVHGGATRQESVQNGLKFFKTFNPDYILVHDAARPFVTEKLISNILTALEDGAEAVIPAIAVTDTLKRVVEGSIEATVDRSGLYGVQTPQGFNYRILCDAHAAAPNTSLTDDAAVLENAGHTVQICAGDPNNFKITHPNDFQKAETHIMTTCADVRTGSGYDVHRFEPGDGPWLCGVKIPFDQTLKGHSDADVGLHALTDAILSAIAEGDIGTHFPPSDPQWRGTDSAVFLQHANSLVQNKGGMIAHVTVCLICEAPKIGPHKDKMRARIAELLAIDVSRVSVQATTTEKLGFTGRGEGIAAQATATIRLPMGDI